MKKLIFFLIVSYSFITSSCNKKAENFSLNIHTQKLVDSIFTTERVSYDDNNNKYVLLLKTASINDLVLLTNYKKPSVRCYAFKALIAKNYPNAKKIFYQHIQDTIRLQSQYSDMSSETTVMKYMLEQFYNPDTRKKYSFDNKEYKNLIDRTYRENK